jgi:hypothetical protein
MQTVHSLTSKNLTPKRIVLLILALLLVVWVWNLLTPVIVRIDAAEQKWNTKNINNYYLVVSELSSISNLRVELVVRNGQITESKCNNPTPSGNLCTKAGGFDPSAYTVPNLFSSIRALSLTKDPLGKGKTGDGLTVTFNETYGYPTLVRFSPNWRVTDTYYKLNVEAFEVMQ